KCANIQMEPMRFSTGRDALDATIKRAFSMKKEKPVESARRPACGNVDKASALTTVPQENKNRRSGLLMCYQIRPSSLAIDSRAKTWGWASLKFAGRSYVIPTA